MMDAPLSSERDRRRVLTGTWCLPQRCLLVCSRTSACLLKQVQFLAGLEADGFSGGDRDFGAGSGIAADAGLAWLDGEDAEASELDPVAGDERLFHAVEDGVDGGFRFGSRQAGALDNPLDEILFDHRS
jgi:hypothetical protein